MPNLESSAVINVGRHKITVIMTDPNDDEVQYTMTLKGQRAIGAACALMFLNLLTEKQFEVITNSKR